MGSGREAEAKDYEAVSEVMSERRCPDCCASPGEPHSPGCDVERCTVCGGQTLTCGGCGGLHDPVAARWTGEWPGDAECRARGWWCQDGYGPHHRWGSFCPCGPDDPGAMLDKNRLAHFRRTGKDDLYEGCPRAPRTAEVARTAK